ncbi:MAG: T9SS type A sorting domain-containing protein [Taibaiella sp.]|jgi:hypothetical protein
MKRIFSTLSLLTLCLSGVYAQRHCDIDVVHVIGPANNSTISNCTDTAIVSGYVFINRGPDVVMPTDTFHIRDVNNEVGWVYIVYPTGAVENGVINGQPAPAVSVGVGDTLLINRWLDHIGRFGTLVDPTTLEYIGPDPGPLFSNGNYLYPIEFVEFVNEAVVVDTALGNNAQYPAITIACPTTGIGDIKGLAKQTLSVYPNPAKNDIFFTYNFEKVSNDAAIRISDIAGRIVLTKTLGKNVIGEQKLSIDVSALHAGTYIIELITEENRAISKFSIK